MVSEKTGYPVEMLEMEMGLDSDLGIDSIKRVEILSTIQERLPGAPLIGPEHLGTLKTLGEIARHLGGTAATAELPLCNRHRKLLQSRNQGKNPESPAAPSSRASLATPKML